MTIDNTNDAPADTADAFLFAVDALREIQSAMAGLAAMETSLYAAVFAVTGRGTGDGVADGVRRDRCRVAGQ